MTFYLICPKCSLDYCVCLSVCVCARVCVWLCVWLQNVEVFVSECLMTVCTSLALTERQLYAPPFILCCDNQHICTVVLFGLERDQDCVCVRVCVCVPAQRDNSPHLFQPLFRVVRRSQTDMQLVF